MSEHSQDPTLIPPTITFLAPPQQTGDIGKLKQYRLLKQLGRGGMGVVYQAMDTELNRVAALKVMHPEFAAHEEARSRFKREAQAAAALKHDHIVTIYQVGEEHGIPFLAMEFLAGKSLEEWLRPDRRATIAETLLVGKQIAKGLAAAHAAGLIHRDIKPANLWLEAPRGRIKLLDFGLARRTMGEAVNLTQDGSVLGTPAYMAPEQARGDAIDHRCDLFSLGCVLYRMLTGKLPFQGSTVYSILTAIASATPPPIRDVRPEVPQRLSNLIDRLLAKTASDRPPSAQAVLDELLAIEKESKQTAAATSLLAPADGAKAPWWSRRTTLIGGAVAALAILVLIVVAGMLSGWGKGESEAENDDDGEPIEIPNEAPAPPPLSSKAVDLLAMIEPVRSNEAGNWTKPSPTQLECESTAKGFDLAVPWRPPKEYRLRLQVTRTIKGSGHLRIGLGQGDHRFAIALGWGKRNLTGLAYIDGKDLDKRHEKSVGKVLPAGEKVLIEITVRESNVTMHLNGAKTLDWTGDLSRLSRKLLMPEEAPLMLGGTRDANFRFDEISLEPLGDDRGRPYPDTPVIDLLARVDVAKLRPPGAWTQPQPGKLFIRSPKDSHPMVLPLGWDPPEEYRLRLKVTRQPRSGRGFMRIALSQGEERFSISIDELIENRGIRSGLAAVDGKGVGERPDAVVRPLLFEGRPVELVITVSKPDPAENKSKLEMEVDGERIYSWKGDIKRAYRPMPPGRGSKERQNAVSRGLRTKMFILCAPESGFLFEEIKLEPLGADQGQPADPPESEEEVP